MNNSHMDSQVQNKIDEISQKYCNPNDKTPFGLRMLMGMGELAKYLSENNNAGGKEDA